MCDQIGDVIALCRVRFQKFAAGRNVEEEILDLKLSAGSEGNVIDGENPSTRDLDLGSNLVFDILCPQPDLGDRGDRGECLTAEPKGQNRFKILG